MSARPLRSAAALLAALGLTITTSPADAHVRQHHAHRGAHHHVRMARWMSGGGHKHGVRPVTASGHGSSTSTGHGSSSAGHGSTSTSTAAQASSAASEPKFGVFTDGSPYSGNVNSVDTLQSALHRHIDIVNWYQNWQDGSWAKDFHSDVVGAVVNSGRTPLLTWEPWDPSKGADQPEFRLRKIVDGDFDDYIASWADQLAALHSTVYLRPMHEMNGNWYPWGATIGDNTPALYIKAWRHMHDIFAAHGADNVKWVWCPLPYSAPNTPDNQLEDYYPGAKYVDVMALDGYNWGSKHQDWGGWQSFDQIFRGAYDRLAKLGSQPIWFAEVGSAPEGGDKAQWVRDMWKDTHTMPRLKALVWFDQNKEEDWSALPVANAFAA